MISLTRLVARSLGAASRYLGTSSPEHLQTAHWGEMEAYFYLRSLGYRIVARNFRTSKDHGEIDIIGWDDGVLCFIEVKTHSHLGLVPPEVAVGTRLDRLDKSKGYEPGNVGWFTTRQFLRIKRGASQPTAMRVAA